MPNARLANALLTQVERIAMRFAPPRIARLHIPARRGDSSGERPTAEFCAIELDDGSFGLSYVLLGDTLQELVRAETTDEPFAGRDSLQLARRFADSEPVARALALATINALTDSVWRRVGYAPPPAVNSLGDVRLDSQDHLGMIGFFPPLVRQVQAIGARLTVIELDEAMVARLRLRFPSVFVTMDRAQLVNCNHIVGTSTMLLNDSLDEMLAASAGAGSFAVIGPSAGHWPDTLFARGVSVVGGTRITDAQGFRSAMATGQPWSSTARKYALSKSEWPGWKRLLT